MQSPPRRMRRPRCRPRRAPAPRPRRSADAPRRSRPSCAERNGRVKERRSRQPEPPLNVRLLVNPSRRAVLAAAALTAALAAVGFMPQLFGSEVERALAGLSGARPAWLWAAAGFFALAV